MGLWRSSAKGCGRWLAQHQVLCAILLCAFIARLFLAELKPYWYDELLSVTVYGSSHDTLSGALEELAKRSAHPPLYHAILYYWMQVFGTGEAATRTLSNIYVTGATFCLYVLALRLFGRRVAIASTLLFAFSYTAIYFGHEVRSYGQSLFLATLSSLLLWRWLEHAGGTLNWRDLFTGRAVGLMLCNIALLLTHYSNALFVIVQALFVGCYVVYGSTAGARLAALGKAAAFYATQFLVSLAIWGPVALSTQRRFAEETKYSVQGLPAHSPPVIFLESVVRPSFDVPLVILALIAILLAIVLYNSARHRFLRGDKKVPLNQYFLFYLAAWATVPCVLVYLFYFAGGWERYVSRYLSIAVPPFTLLLVLSLEQAVKLAGASVRRHYLRNAMLYAILACAVFALPGAYQAAKDPQSLYRDIARAIVTTVEQDPQSSFAIFDAARRRESLLDFYLKRLSTMRPVRVDGTFRMRDERPGRDPLKHVDAEVAGRDYVIVAFPFDSAANFPMLISALKSRYDLAFNQLNGDGFGYLLFKSRRAGTP